MGLRFRQSFRLWKGASIIWNAPISGRRTSQKTNSGYGCLALGMIGTVVLFALIGLISPRSPDRFSATTATYPQQEPPQTAVTLPVNELLPSANEAIVPPLKEANPATEPQRVEPISIQPSKFNLGIVDPAKIYAKLDLASKGFDFKRNAEHNPLFWTLRKADTDREYSAVFLAGDNGKTKAITLELVLNGVGIDGLARNYFKTLIGAIMPTTEAKEAETWLIQLTSSMESKTIAGLQFTWHSTSTTQRRLTIQ